MEAFRAKDVQDGFCWCGCGKPTPISTITRTARGILRGKHIHKFSFWLIKNFGTIAIEDLNVKGLAAGMLAKSVHDVAWAAFFSKLAYKAENAGRRLTAVNPSGTSQTCLCGAKVWKTLSDREHVCTTCGLIAPRDVVSAQVILQRARISPSVANASLVELSVY